MSNQYPVEIDAVTGEVETLPHKGRYRCRLETVADVKREMAKVYRESRSQLIDVSDALNLLMCWQPWVSVSKFRTWKSVLKHWRLQDEF